MSPSIQAPEVLTPEGKLRFADGVVDAKRSRIITVQEDHSGSGEAVNSIAAVGEPLGLYSKNVELRMWSNFGYIWGRPSCDIHRFHCPKKATAGTTSTTMAMVTWPAFRAFGLLQPCPMEQAQSWWGAMTSTRPRA